MEPGAERICPPSWDHDEPFDKCWSDDDDQQRKDAFEEQFTPQDNRIRSHRQGAAEVAKTILSLGTRNVFDRVFYHPNATAYAGPGDVGDCCEVVTFRSRDGTLLGGWFMRARAAATGATIVHFHGCCNNLTHDIPFTEWLLDEGFNVLMFDYRGYGVSEGKPTREGVFLDSLAAMEYVRSRDDVDPARLFAFGQSLGGAIALAAVGEGSQDGILGVVVEGTFLSYRAVVNNKMSNTPITYPLASLMVSDDHAPARSIERIAPIPLQVFHGVRDKVIAVKNGRKVYGAAGDPKEMHEIATGVHLDAFVEHEGRYRAEMLRFLRGCLG